MTGPGPFRGERIDKPWGYELLWARSERYAGKILHIEAGHALSLQFHRVKEETLHVLRGAVDLELGAESDGLRRWRLGPGDSVHVPPGWRHRLTAVVASDVLEVSSPELDDVVRLADRYGRASAPAPAETPGTRAAGESE